MLQINPLRLNLGSSDDRRPGFVSVDRCPPADVIADLNQRWPWHDSTVDEIYAKDIFEHLPKIHAMNQAYRVLKPGGILEVIVPCVHLTDGRVNPGAFADPTHISFYTLDDRYYYCEEWNNNKGERGRLGPAYGITALFRLKKWELVEYGRGPELRSKIFGLLEALK